MKTTEDKNTGGEGSTTLTETDIHNTKETLTKATLQKAEDRSPDTVDGAIDEAIKAETEKLYEEACSNLSSSGIT